MTRTLALLLSTLVTVGLVTPRAQAAGLPLVISATVDYTHMTLTITGQNFGGSPVVTLDKLSFPTVSASSNQIVASFPSGSPPSSFTPATYFLTLQYRNQLPSIFTVDIGANGPQGPQGVAGPAGPQGLQGSPGLTGSTGAVGPMGLPGPMGAAGIAGSIGPAGPQGLTGSTGPVGPQGPAGSAGTGGGSGLPICGGSAVVDVPVFYQGAWTCRSALPRYVNNGDGTLTDNQTGLMWEMQTSACLGEVSCVNNTYTWSAGTDDPNADGTLFTGFIAGLNGGVYFDFSIGQYVGNLVVSNCFANHCDWRLPAIQELTPIILKTSVCNALPGFPCIDPVFGVTQAAFYWTSTSLPGSSGGEAYVGVFNSQQSASFSQLFAKSSATYARAVRNAW